MGPGKRKDREQKEDPSPRFLGGMLVIEILERHPGAKDVLASFGLPCHRCVVAEKETLEEGCRPLGLDPKRILADLNALP
jgi:hybrid cluster-associated redox disulfide protein